MTDYRDFIVYELLHRDCLNSAKERQCHRRWKEGGAWNANRNKAAGEGWDVVHHARCMSFGSPEGLAGSELKGSNTADVLSSPFSFDSDFSLSYDATGLGCYPDL